MKNRTSPVSLLILLFAYICTAQKPAEDFVINEFSQFIADSDKSILTSTENREHHSTLLNALRASDLDVVLSYDGEFTVFAPSNLAFSKLSELTIQRLMDPKNKKELKSILSYHIIAGKLSASKILKAMCRGNGQAMFTTIQGEKITATISGTDIVLTDNNGNQAKIVTADSIQCNGVVHEIDRVFLPLKI